MAASVLEQFLPACEVRTRLEAIASGTDAELLPLLLEDPARVLAEDLCLPEETDREGAPQQQQI